MQYWPCPVSERLAKQLSKKNSASFRLTGQVTGQFAYETLRLHDISPPVTLLDRRNLWLCPPQCSINKRNLTTLCSKKMTTMNHGGNFVKC